MPPPHDPRAGSPRAGRFLPLAFVAPALALLIALNVFPLLYNVLLGFTDAELSGGAFRFTGRANYATLLADPRYLAALRTTGLFVLVAVAAELGLGFAAALALREPFRGRAALLTVLLVPMMLPPAVMGLFWNLVLNGQYGVLNQALAGLGLPAPQWLTDPALKLASILLVDVWMWAPFMLLVALSGLQTVPRALYEAAAVDRAGAWRVFTRITLPHAVPFLLLAALFRATDALKQFDLVMAMTGPNDAATQTLSALLYETLFAGYKVGLGSAYGCIVLVLVIALATAVIRSLDWRARRQGRSAA